MARGVTVAFVVVWASMFFRTTDALDVCITTSTRATLITNLTECLQTIGNTINNDINDAPATTSNLLRVLTFNDSTTQKLATYQLSTWSQTVVLAFVRSMPLRNRLYIRGDATISGTTLTFTNTSSTSATWLRDLGAGVNVSGVAYDITTAPNVIVDGYIMGLADTRKITYGTVSLIQQPQYYDKTALSAAYSMQAQTALVTFPLGNLKFGYYGAVYGIDPYTNASNSIAEAVSLISRRNNLRIRLNATLSNDGKIATVNSVTDLATGDTPVPTQLAGGVTGAPIKETVIGWYIYLIIALGVVGLIGIFICVAKKAKLKKEDKKKVAKRRKKDQDRFDKMASEMRSGIELDEDDNVV